MKDLSRKDLLLVSLMLFSLFFGAGNLIFPPFLGQAAGSSTWITILGFFVTAVGFPVLGVIAVAKSGGLHALASRVNPVFATFFTVLIYISIGPGLGIPRAGSLPFEMAVAPFLPEGLISNNLALFLYTFVFFAVAYWLSLSPAKLVDRMGKVLTPSLLVLIGLIFVASIFKPLGAYGDVTGVYKESPFISGFLDGYMTMDTIAALNFGIVIALVIKSKGVKEEKFVVKTSVKAGIIAGGLLIVIYSMLAHLGATSGGRFGLTENGAQTLSNIITYIFGKPGAILLAVIFTLACLTTCVGLIYPMAIMLIVLAMLDKYIKGNSVVYTTTIAFTTIVSVIHSLSCTGINIEFLNSIFENLPFYSEGLARVLPALFGLGLGLVLKSFFEKNKEKVLEVS